MRKRDRKERKKEAKIRKKRNGQKERKKETAARVSQLNTGGGSSWQGSRVRGRDLCVVSGL